jgi:hypothetical protein
VRYEKGHKEATRERSSRARRGVFRLLRKLNTEEFPPWFGRGWARPVS